MSSLSTNQPSIGQDTSTTARVAANLKNLSPASAAKRMGEGRVPCARSSLLLGLGTAVGVTGVGSLAGRGLKPSLNWGVGAFMFVSLASWETCRRSRKAEQQRMQTIIESYGKKGGSGARKPDETKSASA